MQLSSRNLSYLFWKMGMTYLGFYLVDSNEVMIIY